MKRNYRVGVLGATGGVGQRLVAMLEHHPWFQLTEVVGSERSAGRPYGEAAQWRQESPMPKLAAGLMVKELGSSLECDLLLSALSPSVGREEEERLAEAGFAVVSNCSSHRMDQDVPLLVPEINADHLAVIEQQLRRRHWGSGFIVTNPNCSTVGLALALAPLEDAFGLEAVTVVTMQAISGAGLDGVSAGAIQDNVIPFVSGEEEKLERETRKILGSWDGHRLLPADFLVSAQCNRVAVLDGHTEAVSVRLRSKAGLEQVREAIRGYRGSPGGCSLPSAPRAPLMLAAGRDRPQPRLDRGAGGGMTVTVGRVRACPVLDWKFTLLVHNMVRGAAGAALLNAELLAQSGRLA